MTPVARSLALTFSLLFALFAGCSRQSPAEQAVALAATITEIRQTLPADPSAEQADEIAKPAKRAEKASDLLTSAGRIAAGREPK